ncbi:MAG TPA: DUF5666 domain-containing protein [Bryobacteraceae bacterium]|nr:DUF5666 domain-containing protein [Bryobacteraceae bacterium]
MLKFFSICACLVMLGVLPSSAQEPASSPKPAEHVLGTVTAVDPSSHSVSVKEDKTGTEYTVLLENTKTLLKVPPGAKDLKSATRITADDLQAGDRVDVRGSKPEDNPNAIAARSIVLMSARDLARSHQAEAAAWQHSTAGTVNSVDPAAQKLDITVRTPEGPKAMTVDVSKTTEFTRYSAENPKTPASSQLTDIQPGDQVRVIGQKSEDGAAITAQKVYSGAFRTIAGTVTAIAPDGKELTVKDLQSKQPVQVVLTNDSTVRKLPPMLAMQLARRFNPDFKAGQGGAGANAGQGAANAGNSSGAPPYGAKAGEAARPGISEAAGNHWTGGGNGAPGAGATRAANGDLSQILGRLPAITLSQLKPGDAVVISGVAQGADKSHLLASSIIAGVEPIFQSAPPRQGQSLGDWSLDMQAPAQQ